MLNTVNMIIQLENSYGFPTVEKKNYAFADPRINT